MVWIHLHGYKLRHSNKISTSPIIQWMNGHNEMFYCDQMFHNDQDSYNEGGHQHHFVLTVLHLLDTYFSGISVSFT